MPRSSERRATDAISRGALSGRIDRWTHLPAAFPAAPAVARKFPGGAFASYASIPLSQILSVPTPASTMFLHASAATPSRSPSTKNVLAPIRFCASTPQTRS